ncbi:MAG TPA: hypothetical protein VGG57_11515 [Stellaceae bacterium]
MTLYLKAIVGRTGYLIAAMRVGDVAPAESAVDETAVDCRLLFGEPAAAPGYRLVVDADTDEPIVFVVDRIDGLVELGDDSFRTLPPIGRFGAAIDAVSVPVGDEAPALRLIVGPALLAGGA